LRFLTPSAPDVIGQFQANAALGVTGSGYEVPLLSLLSFLDQVGAGGYNAGFLRAESLFSVIVVTDEDETRSNSSPSYLREFPAERVARVDQVVNRLKALRPENPAYVRLDAIVAPSAALCGSGYGNAYGEVVRDVATRMGGTINNICQDFSDELQEIGSTLVKVLTRFKILQPPTGTIEVRVGGEVVPQNEVNGWVYLRETQEVEFRGSAVPAADATINVSYVPGAPI
jgi:hypothetical protein